MLWNIVGTQSERSNQDDEHVTYLFIIFRMHVICKGEAERLFTMQGRNYSPLLSIVVVVIILDSSGGHYSG